MQLGQKQILIVLAASLLLAVVVFAKLQLQRADVLPVNEVQLQGVFEHVDDGLLAKTVLPVIRGNFFTVNVDAIHAQVSAFPWVAYVWVDRIWPNMLRIRIQEEQAVAVWNDAGLLNGNAKLFVQGGNDEALHARLFGPEGEQGRVLEKQLALDALLQDYALRISSLKVDERLSWQAQLDNGLLLELGRKDIELRVRRFVEVYQSFLQKQLADIEAVDLRYANGFSVRWKASVNADKK